MTIDGRKYVRFLVRGDSFAALRNGFKKVGKINDISVNGLGFSFLHEVTHVDPKGHDSQIDIFSAENGFHLSNVPCRVVYEISDATSIEGFSVQMSRCGLQFLDLPRHQVEQLKLFLESHTIEV